MKPLSIKDIAKLAGVAPSTVSFVLNGKEKEMRISEEMAHKIRNIIQETGYVPNRSAASLRTGRTHNIGLIVEDISNSFFALLAKSIEDIAYEAGYRVAYCSTENDGRKESELIKMLYKQVDGFIITPTSNMVAEILRLQNVKKPLVLLDRYFPDTDIPCVLVDNKAGVERGVDLLISKQYRNIGFIITNLEQIQMQERLEAYTNRIKKYGFFKETLLLKLPFSAKENAYSHAIKNYFENNPELDAIFFATNYLSIQGLKVLQDLQWEIPNRVAVLSFDDHDIFKLYTPSITAINQPIADIARQGVELLIKQMNNQEQTLSNPITRLEASLIVRNSA